MADHDQLLHQVRERVGVAYLKALEKELVDPVVLDLQDRFAERFIQSTSREQKAAAMIARAARRGGRALAVLHVPPEFAARLSDAEGYTEIATMLRSDSMPVGSVALVVAANGVVSVAACPVPPD